MTPQEFIAHLKDDALRLSKLTGIPAAIIIAQAALETGWGKHTPIDIETGKHSFNIFGVKWHESSTHDYVVANTREFKNGEWVTEPHKFRVYNSWYESLEDYVQFLLRNPRYENCFTYSNDPIRFAMELQRAGYATDPDYAAKLINIMQRNGLLELEYEGGDGERMIRTAFMSVVIAFARRIVKRALGAFWDEVWTHLAWTVEMAEKKWQESGHGQEKKAWVINTVVEWIGVQKVIGWIPRQALKVLLNWVVDRLLNDLNSQLGQDWVKKVFDLKSYLEGRIGWI